ncbi:ABC transporter ATP-binding protein [Phragmitibacter flavus]|uniref:ABC transporter ATP-binding protein n=1 Tax=Phragmitibacter flavus TaxID=2576071 RepID=A0A5R8KFJ0_9BACT|nr:ABC transporter ATP-binding protein [Phragmitibacter flavus]TLD71074.1 ABC transporter ATP-binding protein [Phragmitibacter flavus]
MRARLNEISKRFGGTVALDELTLDLPAGSVVAVLGLNGAGKSTLLKVMAGVSALDAGTVLYDGEVFHRERLDLRRRLLFTSESPMFFPGKSVLRNLAVFLEVYEKNAAEREERIVELLQETGMAGLVLKEAGTLSRGQVWKLALACAVAVRPELWLVDEPFASGMDVLGLAAFKRVARSLADEGGLVIYTTQLAEMAVGFADYICLLNEGRVALWESSESVKRRLKDEGVEVAELFRGMREEIP